MIAADPWLMHHASSGGGGRGMNPGIEALIRNDALRDTLAERGREADQTADIKRIIAENVGERTRIMDEFNRERLGLQQQLGEALIGHRQGMLDLSAQNLEERARFHDLTSGWHTERNQLMSDRNAAIASGQADKLQLMIDRLNETTRHNKETEGLRGDLNNIISDKNATSAENQALIRNQQRANFLRQALAPLFAADLKQGRSTPFENLWKAPGTLPLLEEYNKLTGGLPGAITPPRKPMWGDNQGLMGGGPSYPDMKATWDRLNTPMSQQTKPLTAPPATGNNGTHMGIPLPGAGGQGASAPPATGGSPGPGWVTGSKDGVQGWGNPSTGEFRPYSKVPGVM